MSSFASGQWLVRALAAGFLTSILAGCADKPAATNLTDSSLPTGPDLITTTTSQAGSTGGVNGSVDWINGNYTIWYVGANTSSEVTEHVRRLGADSWSLDNNRIRNHTSEDLPISWTITRKVVANHAATIACEGSVGIPPMGPKLEGIRCDIPGAATAPSDHNWETTVDLSDPTRLGKPMKFGNGTRTIETSGLLEFKLSWETNQGYGDRFEFRTGRNDQDETGENEFPGIQEDGWTNRTVFLRMLVGMAPTGNIWTSPGSYPVWVTPAPNTLAKDWPLALEASLYCCLPVRLGDDAVASAWSLEEWLDGRVSA